MIKPQTSVVCIAMGIIIMVLMIGRESRITTTTNRKDIEIEAISGRAGKDKIDLNINKFPTISKGDKDHPRGRWGMHSSTNQCHQDS